MSEHDEYNEACKVASTLANGGMEAEELVRELNSAFEAAFYELKGVIYMRRELDYLPSLVVIKFA